MSLIKFLILRRPQSGRLEGRTMLIQAPGDFLTAAKAGVQGLFRRSLAPWIPVAGMTGRRR
jgi:hypothetical protein